jgi:sulfur-carrier protein adenylyltransferase/sulfurtransferase
MEILKLALGKGAPLVGRLVLFNALDMKVRELKLRRDPQCPICGIQPAPAEPASHPDEVTVPDMKRALDEPKLGIQVVDVREPDKYEIAKVNGVPLLPLSQNESRFTELDPDQTCYLHCQGGVRSLKPLNFLRQQGFK